MLLQNRTRSESTTILDVCKFTMVYYQPAESRTEMAQQLKLPESRVCLLSSPAVAALFVISRWSMRISEYLAVAVGDLQSDDMVFVAGAKKSCSYRIFLPGAYTQLRVSGIIPLGRAVAGINYHQLYMECIRSGVGEVIPGRHVVARTHIFRHRLADATRCHGDSAVGDVLHHRSPSSQQYYGVKERFTNGKIT